MNETSQMDEDITQARIEHLGSSDISSDKVKIR